MLHHHEYLRVHVRDAVDECMGAVVGVGADHVHALHPHPVVFLQNVPIAIQLQSVLDT